jgi:hypothetical protein
LGQPAFKASKSLLLQDRATCSVVYNRAVMGELRAATRSASTCRRRWLVREAPHFRYWPIASFRCKAASGAFGGKRTSTDGQSRPVASRMTQRRLTSVVTSASWGKADSLSSRLTFRLNPRSEAVPVQRRDRLLTSSFFPWRRQRRATASPTPAEASMRWFRFFRQAGGTPRT